MAEYERERQIARKLYLHSGGSLTLAEIARRVGRPASTVRSWKRKEEWDRQIQTHDGADNKPVPAVQHGLYAVPRKVRGIMEAAQGMDERNLLWEVILYQYASIVRAQELMYVKDGDDTRFLARGECGEGDAQTAYEPHAAWDRHAAFMQAQSRAVATFNNSLKAYQQLALGSHTADAREQQARLLKQKVKKMAETQSPEVHIHTYIPRPDGHEKEAL